MSADDGGAAPTRAQPAPGATVPPFRGWTHPGPVPPGALAGEAPAEGETLDFLAGHWRLFQLRGGHRFSTDDVLTGWYGSHWAPRVSRYCDLGSGIGSVAAMVAWRLPGCAVVTVEAQAQSLALQRRSWVYNGLDARVTALSGDLRDVDALLPYAPFDLVTGSPPYWDLADASPAQHPQAVPARLEVRGTIADYAHTAARLLAPGGVFACVFPDVQDPRARAALSGAGLTLIRSRPVCFKRGVPSTAAGIRLYLAGRATDLPPDYRAFEEPPLVIREADGSVSPEYSAIKLSMGLPPG